MTCHCTLICVGRPLLGRTTTDFFYLLTCAWLRTDDGPKVESFFCNLSKSIWGSLKSSFDLAILDLKVILLSRAEHFSVFVIEVNLILAVIAAPGYNFSIFLRDRILKGYLDCLNHLFWCKMCMLLMKDFYFYFSGTCHTNFLITVFKYFCNLFVWCGFRTVLYVRERRDQWNSASESNHLVCDSKTFRTQGLKDCFLL